MAVIEVRLPQLGMGMVDGQVTQWLKSPGESVAAGEPLVAVDNGKATVEVESPATGRLRRIVVPTGATAPVGDVLAEIESA
ncbi:MAG: biotin attachment protein [Chloroflexi bacterium]|nr:biotin attachment protein [Chloroflexota bacterium]MBI4505610.1 biotin attachment protein [Chloroflexota bacterium]